MTIKKKGSLSISEDYISEVGGDILLCSIHQSKIEFICKNITCLKELCGHCILLHAEHINSIISLKIILKESLENGVNTISNPNIVLDDLSHNLKNSTLILDSTIKQITETATKVISNHKNKLINMYETARSTTKNLANFNEIALSLLENGSEVTKDKLEIIKTFLKYNNDQMIPRQNLNPSFNFDQINMISDVERAITNNIFLAPKESFDTTELGCLKLLHWFEWGKKKLNLYNIATNTTEAVDLDISFKIPSFSRSIIIPNGQIYLMGGEEPEYFSRKEVYMYDHSSGDRKFHSKASMINKKFDFTLCYLNGYIFVMCGKDSSSEVADTCEKFCIVDNQWISMSSVKKKRYAASAVGFTNNKIYLFGGRSDFNNNMVSDIEEYNIALNEWNILNVKNFNLWNPVEVCACIQIKEDQILIFGGSDARIKDSNNSLLFNVGDYSFEKKGELKRAQVFVNAPFLYKNQVFALGNEYYMKHRNLHRYSIGKEEWEIIF